MRRVAVVGGGVAGLAAAQIASGLGAEVVVYEGAESPGGLVHTRTLDDGSIVEHGPDSLVASRPATSRWLERLGLMPAAIGVGPRGRGASVLLDGRLVPMPAGFMAPSSMSAAARVLRSPLLTWRGRLRLALEPLRRRGVRGTDESVKQFVGRRFGDEFLDRLVRPVIDGIHATPVERLSAEMALGPLVATERAFGSIGRSLLQRRGETPSAPPSFVTFQNGMKTLVERLAIGPFDLRLCTPALGLERTSGRYRVTSAGASELFDDVVLCTPTAQAGALLGTLLPEASRALRAFDAGSLHLVTLAFCPRDGAELPAGSGFVVARPAPGEMRACTFSTQKFPAQAKGTELLVRCFFSEDAADVSAESLVSRAESTLASLVPGIGPAMLVDVTRHRSRLPRFDVGHRARVRELRGLLAESPGVFVAGSAFDGPGVVEAMESGAAAATEAIARF